MKRSVDSGGPTRQMAGSASTELGNAELGSTGSQAVSGSQRFSGWAPPPGDLLEVKAARSAVATALFPSLDHEPTSVGRYLLRRRLGAGGMGIVFEAEDPHLRRNLAIKLLHPLRHQSQDGDSLLLKEAQSTARLVHPGVVTVFDAGVHEGRVFIAMELVEGQTMADWLASGPDWKLAVAVLAKAARGLEAAHSRGIVHRDFKPGNVLLGYDGRVCVADFGLAKETSDPHLAEHVTRGAPTGNTFYAVTGSGEVVGTPAYMAPEQYLGTVQDERTDQFAFCVSLYEALFGTKPFMGRTLLELRDNILASDPRMPWSQALPKPLVSAVFRGLSKQRRDRFTNMAELASLLESLSGDANLAEVFRDAPPGSVAPLGSAYQQYLRMLPHGLDTTPEHRLPTRVTQMILAQKPLVEPPPEMVPVIASLYREASIPAVHGRALLSAFYDAHFQNLDHFAEFMGQVSQSVMKVMFGLSWVPSPASPHYVQVMLSVYNNSVQGMDLSIVEAGRECATIQVDHPANTMNEVCRVSIAEVVRAAFLATGCRLAEVTVVSRTEDRFRMKADFR